MITFARFRKKIRNLRFRVKSFIAERLIKIAPIKDCLPSIVEVPYPIKSKEIATAEIMDMPIIDSALHFKNPVYQMPTLFSAVLDNVYYCSDNNTIVTQDRTVVKESINSVTNKARFKVSSIYFRKRETVDGCCTLFRSVSNEFYHVIIDNLPGCMLCTINLIVNFRKLNYLLIVT